MNNFAKLWIQRKLNDAAILRAKEEIFSTGWALPCTVTAVNGPIVTVSFEVDSTPWVLPQITIPKAESPWIRMPTQIGDTGITIPADCHLGNISGLGTGIPKINATMGNLSGLVFMPVSNKNNSPIDQNAAQIEGPNGAIIRTTGGTTSNITVSTTNITITFGNSVVTVDSTGIKISGAGGTPVGIVQGNCICAFTGTPHAMISATVEGSV